MGNSSSSTQANPLDLSLGTLDSTRTDDKEWLGVAEENLFNEAFTNEKYYTLRSRGPSYGPPLVRSEGGSSTLLMSDSTKKESGTTTEHKLLSLDEDLNETVLHIAEQLSNNSYSTAYFEKVLQKRLTVLQRIHLAFSRERARSKLLVPLLNSREESRPKHSAPPTLSIAVQLFITFVRVQPDRLVGTTLLSTLNQLLADLPPLSLKDDSIDCLQRFNEWLLAVLTSGDDKTGGIDSRTHAMESLIYLALGQGSLQRILSILNLYFKRHPAVQGVSDLKVGPTLRRLAGWKIYQTLSSLSKERLSGTWTVGWNDSDSVAFMSSSTPNNATITTDGSYLYLHDVCGLVKIGTGHFGTVKGRVYTRIATFEPREKGWLAFIHKKLYYRSLSVKPASLVILDPSTLKEEARVYQDVEGYVSNQPSNPSSARRRDRTAEAVDYTRCPILSDGRYLYMIVHVTYAPPSYPSSRLYVEIYDPLNSMRKEERIELRYPEVGGGPTTVPVLVPENISSYSYYTNGHYLMVVIPPPLAAAYGYTITSCICRSFSISDGTFVGNFSVPDGLETPTCYDYINNVIWNYSSKETEVAQYDNEGLAPKHIFPVEEHSVVGRFVKRLSVIDLPHDDRPLSLQRTTAAILGSLSRLSVDCMPSPTEAKPNHIFKHREPFCVEVCANTFSLLYSIMQSCQVSILEVSSQPPLASGSSALASSLALAPSSLPPLSSTSSSSLSSSFPSSASVLTPPPSLTPSPSSWTSSPAPISAPFSVSMSPSPPSTPLSASPATSYLPTVPLPARPASMIPITPSPATSPKGDKTFYYQVILYCLRILKVNIHRFIFSDINGEDVGLGKAGSKDNEGLFEKLRVLLHSFVESTQLISSDEVELATAEMIQMEACETLTVGLGLFYPSPVSQTNLLLDLLSHSGEMSTKKRASLPLQEVRKNPGWKIFLDAILVLLSRHTNPSFLLLPPDTNEVTEFRSLNLGAFADSSDSLPPFNPMVSFIPIISHLFREAQETMVPLPQNAAQKSEDFADPSYSLLLNQSSAGVDSSPAMRLLLAMQKDLLFRAEKWQEEAPLNALSIPPKSAVALLAYSKLVIEHCRSMIKSVISQEHHSRSPSLEEWSEWTILQDTKSSVIGALLPTLTHSLFLFSSNTWLAKELLPSLLELIDILDVFNRRLPKLSGSRLHSLQRSFSSEFVEGPSMISESDHPYLNGVDTLHTITIPDAVFLSIVFDERCCTEDESDFLQLYQDPQKQTPIGERFSGDRSKWPKRRMLVPGDRVVFNFKSDHSNSDWGYRCVVIGHMPRNKTPRFPWSAHLEKTLCCLAGQFSGSLISGKALTELERIHSSLLASPLMNGLDERFVGTAIPNYIELSPESDSSGIFDSTDEMLEAMPMSSQAENDFLQDVFSAKLATEANSLVEWIHQHLELFNDPIKIGVIGDAQRAALAAFLKHKGLVGEAIAFAHVLRKQKDRSGIAFRKKPRPPPVSLSEILPFISQVREAIIQRHQELVLNKAIETEISSGRQANPVSEPVAAEVKAREAIYKEICSGIIQKSQLLLYLISAHLCAPQQPLAAHGIISFVISPVSLERIKLLIFTRRIRAISRARGFRFMKKIVNSAHYSTMRHEALCFLGPALRNSARETNRIWPRHYLDHLRGAGDALQKCVSSAFVALMSDLAEILAKQKEVDASLQLLALDPWAMSYRPEDQPFLHKVNIFSITYNLMLRDITGMEAIATDEWMREYEKGNRGKMRSVAQAMFSLLGIVCLQMTEPGGKPSELQESFFNLIATHLETAIPDVPFEVLLHQSLTTVPSLDRPSTETGEWNVYSIVSLLYNVSSSPVAKVCLSKPRFLKIFLYLMTDRDKYLRVVVVRILRRILLVASPDVKVRDDKTLISLLLDTIGSIYLRSYPLSSAELSATQPTNRMPIEFPFRVSKSLTQSYAERVAYEERHKKPLPSIPPPATGAAGASTTTKPMVSRTNSGTALPTTPRGSGIGKASLVSTPSGTKLQGSNAFFPLKLTPDVSIAMGWDPNRCFPDKAVRFSVDRKTVTYGEKPIDEEIEEFNGAEEVPIVVVCADAVISEALPLYYFEVRIDHMGKDRHVFIGLASADSCKTPVSVQTFSKEIYNYRSDGVRACLRSVDIQEPYEGDYGKGDVIGCGWDLKTGVVFFTKNGQSLGSAFKNVFGRFYPAVGLLSKGASLFGNFGQVAYRFNINAMADQAIRSSLADATLAVARSSLSLASDLVILLRCLLRASNWKQALQQIFTDSFESINLLLESLAKKKKQKKTDKKSKQKWAKGLHSILVSLLVLGGHTSGIRLGSAVIVDGSTSGSPTETGLVIDLPSESSVTVLMGNRKRGKTIAVFPKSMVRPVMEVPPSIQPSQSTYSYFVGMLPTLFNYRKLSPTTAPYQNVITHVLSMALKVMENWLKTNASEVIPVVLAHSDLLPSMLETAFAFVPNKETHHTPHLFELLALALKEHQLTANLFPPTDLGQESATLTLVSAKKTSYRASIDDLVDWKGQPKSEERMGYDEAETTAASVLFGFPVRKLAWAEAGNVSILLVGKKDYSSASWSLAMDKTVGTIGAVQAVDRRNRLVLLRFYDIQLLSFIEYWYPVTVLYVPDGIARDFVFDILDTVRGGQQGDFPRLIHSVDDAITTLNCRQTFMSLFANYPEASSVPLNINLLGGMPKWVNLLRLVVLNNSDNLSINKYNLSPELRALEVKLAAIIKAEAVFNLPGAAPTNRDPPPRSSTAPNNSTSPPGSQNSGGGSNSGPMSVKTKRFKRESSAASLMIPSSSGGEKEIPNKVGWLSKQSKLLKTWKKQWCVLHDSYFFYYKSLQTQNPLGFILLTDIIAIEEVSVKTTKKDNCFSVQTTTRTFVFQASSKHDRDGWINVFRNHMRSSESNLISPRIRSRTTSNPLNDGALSHQIIMATIHELNATAPIKSPLIKEESDHPYPFNPMKKMVRMGGAEALLVVFDPECHILEGYHVLSFYSDPEHTQLIRSFTGYGAHIYTPFIISGDRFCIDFHMDSTAGDESILAPIFWGYRFYVAPYRMRLPDKVALSQPSFEFAFCMTEWLLSLHPMWTKEFYSNDIVDAIASHLSRNPPLHQKIRIFSALTRLLQRWAYFAKGNKPNLHLLGKLKEELFALHKVEMDRGERYHTLYYQHLAELAIHIIIAEEKQRAEEDRLIAILGGTSEPVPPRKRDHDWIYAIVKIVKTMKYLLRYEAFPDEFVKESVAQCKRQVIVEESPHPYPTGVKVTFPIHIAKAKEMTISFDSRCSTEPDQDYLLFDRSTAGGADLGYFSGEFGNTTLVIEGEQFVYSFLSASPSTECWGFRFTITPSFPYSVKKDWDTQTNIEFEEVVVYFQSADWSLAMDQEMVRFIDVTCERAKLPSSNVQFRDCDITGLRSQYPSMALVSAKGLAYRFQLLKYFNTLIIDLLPIVDLRNVTEDWSLGYSVCALRGLIFFDIKVEVLNEILNQTQSYLPRPVITLIRHESVIGKAAKRQQAQTSPQDPILLSNLLFIQAFNQLSSLDPMCLRQNDRAFEVRLFREGATDAGGPYREVITQFCAEIQSRELGLFIPCPNANSELGFNQDKFIPNPSANSPTDLAYYEFIGKLIGIAIRTRNQLDLSLPSIIWKQIVCTRVDATDLAAIDTSGFKFLDSIRNIDKEGVTAETFNDVIFENFTILNSNGQTVELKTGGKDIPVTWENRLEFSNLVEQYRLNEFKLQIQMMARGIAAIIPSHLLPLFTWQQLELRVCGRPGVDIELLKKHTSYRGVNADDKLVADFWSVLSEFSPEEQQLFIRFVWGRSRLPSGNDFDTEFQLQFLPRDATNNHDKSLPNAQTCFFSLTLPRYSSLTIMRDRLLYAINTCREIDSDFVVPDLSNATFAYDSDNDENE